MDDNTFTLASYVKDLEYRIDRLERRSGLMSRSWFTRALTVSAYLLAIQLLGAVVLVVLAIAFGLLSS